MLWNYLEPGKLQQPAFREREHRRYLGGMTAQCLLFFFWVGGGIEKAAVVAAEKCTTTLERNIRKACSGFSGVLVWKEIETTRLRKSVCWEKVNFIDRLLVLIEYFERSAIGQFGEMEDCFSGAKSIPKCVITEWEILV